MHYTESSDDEEWPEDRYRRMGKTRHYPVSEAQRWQQRGGDMIPEPAASRVPIVPARLPEHKRFGLYNRDGTIHKAVDIQKEKMDVGSSLFNEIIPPDINIMMFILLLCFVISLVINGFMIGRFYGVSAAAASMHTAHT